MSKHIITKVIPGSIAEELELEVGDELVSINGQEIIDVIDYRYLVKEEEIVLVIFRPTENEEWEFEIEKDETEELGIEFESGLMDEYRSCRNNCVFCFIDQLPKGMRETLYFKDDDSRLAFLQGNYITLTNMAETEIDRIIKYHLMPLNISVQTMNMELRKKMLHNRFASNLKERLDRFYEAGIVMNGQIVLCKGLNDGNELEYSISELMKYLPYMQSVSIVPIGLTKFREELMQFEQFTREDAREIVKTVEKYQKIAFEKYSNHFIHLGDEFYYRAELSMPVYDNYDGFTQYENGVGMTRLLDDEFNSALNTAKQEEIDEKKVYKSVSLITGKLAEGFVRELAKSVEKEILNTKIDVFGIRNDFFGEKITVAGLVTGGDIYNQLKDKELGEILYIPADMLKSDEDIFLDDMTLEELSKKLKRTIIPLTNNGETFFKAMCGIKVEQSEKYEMYHDVYR